MRGCVLQGAQRGLGQLYPFVGVAVAQPHAPQKKFGTLTLEVRLWGGSKPFCSVGRRFLHVQIAFGDGERMLHPHWVLGEAFPEGRVQPPTFKPCSPLSAFISFPLSPASCSRDRCLPPSRASLMPGQLFIFLQPLCSQTEHPVNHI